EDGAAAVALFEHLRERRGGLVHVAFVGEECGHDLACERGIAIELQQQGGALERLREHACTDGQLDGTARDLRIVQLAGEAIVDLERTLVVAALRGDLRGQVFEYRRRGGRPVVDFVPR